MKKTIDLNFWCKYKAICLNFSRESINIIIRTTYVNLSQCSNLLPCFPVFCILTFLSMFICLFRAYLPIYFNTSQHSAAKSFRKTNISYPLIRTRTCAYQEVRNVSFSENFCCRILEIIGMGDIGTKCVNRPLYFYFHSTYPESKFFPPPLSTRYGVWLCFCFSLNIEAVFKGVSMELIFCSF